MSRDGDIAALALRVKTVWRLSYFSMCRDYLFLLLEPPFHPKLVARQILAIFRNVAESLPIIAFSDPITLFLIITQVLEQT